jgi:ribosomal 50S subunit-recycling heat shock protein
MSGSIATRSSIPPARLDRGVLVWRILALGDRRGPAVEARLLYEDIGSAQARDEG